MTQKPPLKPLSPQDWEILIDDFQYGGFRRQKWSSQYRVSSILDQALSSILRKDFPLKLQVIVFIEEFAESLFSDSKTADAEQLLDCLVDALRAVVQAPIDNVHITFGLKEQMLVSATSIFVSVCALEQFHVRYFENLVELLVTVINRPNHGLDRHIRAVACECLRELERSYPCLLSDVAGHLWSLCQSERTHASQSYILLLTNVIHDIVTQKLNVSILNTSVPLIPFNVPQLVLGSNPNSNSNKDASGLNYKELRRAISFLLEWPHVLTPCGTMEFMSMIMPLAMNLELQASMLKVQFFGMIYSFDPMLCHAVLMLYSHFTDAFDGQEKELAWRLMLIAREAQHHLVFRLLALHWLLGFNGSILNRDVKKMRTIVQSGLSFSPTVFDPLALKALKLDLIAFCSLCLDTSKLESVSGLEAVSGMSVVKLFEDGLVSVSAFKWLPPWSTETAVAFRTFHKFLIGSSSHSDTDSSATRVLVESTIFNTLKVMLVDLTLEFQRLVPVIVSFIDRLLACEKHQWLGERLLQTFDEHLLPKVKTDYNLASYFPIFNRIAENDEVPPRRLLELLTKFMVFLVKGHGPDMGLRSWSQGSKVLGICRTMLMHHHGSRLFIRLSRLLGFTCLYFPDLEVRDNARIYLRMLICIPGKKLREVLNLGEQLLGVSPAPHSSSFFSVQSPRPSHNFRKPKNISSYIQLQRIIPLLVKQTWSLSLSTFGIGSDKASHVEDSKDSDSVADERENNANTDMQIIAESKRISQPPEPLRVMDSKIAEILGTLRRHFSCIPDYRHMSGFKVTIPCCLKLDSEPFCRVLGVDFPADGVDGVAALPALYATVLKFSSSAPYGSIKSYHIPFLLGEAPKNDYRFSGSLDIVPVENGSGSGPSEDDNPTNGASVTIELEPREPTPGLVDIFIETNTENGEIIHGQLQSIQVGIEDMFLKPVVPDEITEPSLPDYYLSLYNALWEACGTCSSTGCETFPLKGAKGVAAISGTRSVKLLEVPAHDIIQAIERYLAPFVVGVTGDSLIGIIKDGGIIDDIVWSPDSPNDVVADSVSDFNRGPLQIKYIDDEDDRDSPVSVGKRNMGCVMVLIFLPPRFHLLLQMEVCNVSTLVRIRTDHWPCLAYIDDYLEALFLE